MNEFTTVNDYEDREKVAFEVILPLWNDVLREEEWVVMTLDELRTQALVKYSPLKVLTK